MMEFYQKNRMYRREQEDVLQSSRSKELICQDKELARKDKELKLKMLNPACGDVDQTKNPIGNGARKVYSKPIKMLIHEEMLKEAESRNRSPSIVARLMGLDAVPASQAIPKQKRKVGENTNTKLTFENQRKQSQSLLHVYKQHPRNNRSPEIHSSRGHVVEHQEFKDVYEIQEVSRVHELNHLGHQTGSGVGTKLLESDLAFVRKKFMDAKRLATDEKLRYSKEFHDVLEDLHSNKDLFLRVLQEPDSLSTKHLHKLHSVSSTSTSSNITVLNSSNTSVKVEVSNAHGSDDIYWKSKRKYEGQISLQKGSPSCPDRHNNSRFSREGTSVYPSHKPCRLLNHENEDHVTPTRIVVLKPRLLPKSRVLTPQHSSTNHRRHRVRRSVSQDILEEDGSESLSKDYSRVSDESNKQRTKSSREIAREVTRQLRQGVDRIPIDILSMPLSDFSGDEQSYNLLEEKFIDRPRLFAPRRQSHELSSKLNSCPSYQMESTVRKEAKKRLSERWKISHSSKEVGHFGMCSGTLGEMLGMSEVNNEQEESLLSLGDMMSHDDSSNSSAHKYSSTIWDSSRGRSSRDFRTREVDYATDLPRSRSYSVLTESCGLPMVVRPFGSVDDIVNDLIKREVITPVPERSFSRNYYRHKDKPPVRIQRSQSYQSNLFQSTKPDSENLSAACDHPSMHCRARLAGMHSDDEMFRSDIYSRICSDFTDCTERLQESPSVAASYSEVTSEHQDDFASQDLEPSPQSMNLKELYACISSDAENMAEVLPTVCYRVASPLQSLPQGGLSDTAHDPPQKENKEQPSPVSILESPFEEDCSSSECFEKISADLDGLRKQLRLIRMESLQKYDDDDGSDIQPSLVEDCMDEGYNSLDEQESTKERSMEFVFLRDVLMSSGFYGDSINLCSWYSPESPLDPYLFEQLDEKYSEQTKNPSNKDVRVQRSERRLLFDRINSGIVSILGPFSDRMSWMKSVVTSGFPRVLGGQGLVNELWELLKNVGSENEEELIDIVRQDLAKDSGWMQSGEGVDMISTEIERSLIGDLIVQMLSEFCTH